MTRAAHDDARPHGSIAVIVTTCNDAHFLPDALGSIARQTRPPDEVIVVDDASASDPSEMVARFPAARLIRRDRNDGPSAARNTGLRAASAEFVTFLDADDALLPRALEAGLACMTANPGAAFVHGAFRLADEGLTPKGGVRYEPVGEDPLATILMCNSIAMHATVLYRRAILTNSGGFDPSLREAEEYDVYLRIAGAHAVASHPEPVALYRMHAASASQDARKMLIGSVAVQDAHRPRDDAGARQQAWAAGRDGFRDLYAREALDALAGRSPKAQTRGLAELYRLWARTRAPGRGAVADTARFSRLMLMPLGVGLVRASVPRRAKCWLRALRSRAQRPSAIDGESP